MPPVLAEQLSLDDIRIQIYQHHQVDGASLVVTLLVRAFVPGPLLPDEVPA